MLVSPEIGELRRSVIGDHGSLSGFPSGGADFTMFVSVHEGLDESQGLINVTSNGEVRDGGVSESTLTVDNVSGTECDALVLTFSDQRAVCASDGLGHVGDHGDHHLAKTALRSGLLGVLHVGEVGVDGASDDLSADLLELRGSVTEITDLSGAHKGEVEGPEEQDGVLSYKIK